MRYWTKLKIGETVNDSTCMIVPNHVGKVVKRLDEPGEYDLDDTQFEIVFYSGRTETCKRKNLGPLAPINPFDSYWMPKVEEEIQCGCFTCKCGVTPTIFFYNCCGLLRGICPECGSSAVPGYENYFKEESHDRRKAQRNSSKYHPADSTTGDAPSAILSFDSAT